MAISKKEMNIHALHKDIRLFACPLCQSTMKLAEQSRFVCEDNHSFDISRQGYIHLAPQAHATKYDRSLFEARNNIMTNGFFNPLLEKIIDIIHQFNNEQEQLKMIDAGSGEGSHLAHILSQFPNNQIDGFGIDLAKEGILRAAKDYPGHSWVVADLANSPFQDNAFHILLNILSPANYSEFSRILKKNGLFIKVVPGKNYLKQLRQAFHADTEREERDPVAQVAEHFTHVKAERMTYHFPLDSKLLESLIRMTPLTWHASEDQVKRVLSMDIPFVTVDLTVIIATDSVIEKGEQ